ncbi:hypothetical protein AB4Z21_24080 [Paenibacillus sp. MCAF20]
MKALVKFELYKIFRQKSIYIVLVVMLFLITLSMGGQFGGSSTSYYQSWEGELTEEKVESADAAWQAISAKYDGEDIQWSEEDRMNVGVLEAISNLHFREMQRAEQTEALKEYLYTAEQNGGRGYEQRKAELHLSMLENFRINQFYYSRGAGEVIDFVNTFGLVISGALLLVGLASIFSNEYATGMDQFQLSSKLGRKQLVSAKIIASLMYLALVVFIWEVFSIIYQINKYGGGGWQSPVQKLFKYSHSPYAMDLATYGFVQLGMHLLGAVVLVTVILLVSALCRHTMLSFLISGTLFALPIVIVNILKIDISWLTSILQFSMTKVMAVEVLFMDFSTINVFGLPVLYPFVAIAVMVALIALCLSLLYGTMRRKEVI